MKEFILTQPYSNLEEMLNSAEVGIYKEELQQGNIDKYAIVSRIGNRYDINGVKINDCASNPFYLRKQREAFESKKIVEKQKILEEKVMKYLDIEALIDKEVEKAVSELKTQHEQEIANLKDTHAQELANAKYEAKAELLAKLNA